MSDQGESKDICPFEKRCPLGCPCKFFVCEHVDHKKFPLVWYHNETDPMFELKDGHQENFYHDYIWDSEPANKIRRHFSRMALFNLQERKKLYVYERIVFLRPNTDTRLSSLKYPQREIEEYVEFCKFIFISIPPCFVELWVPKALKLAGRFCWSMTLLKVESLKYWF